MSFDSEAKSLSFSTDGPSGSTGYVNVIIPKSLVADISTIGVFLDGNEVNYNSASQSDSWSLSFTYHQSSHNLVIGLNETPTQSTGLPIDTTLIIGALVAVIIALVAAVTVLFKKRNPKVQSKS